MFKQLLLLCTLICYVHSKTVIIGQTSDSSGQVRKVYEKQVEATGIPLIEREEEVEFVNLQGDLKIKGIIVKDLENGLGVPSIIGGGVGFNFVNLKLKSAQGTGIQYLIEIYA